MQNMNEREVAAELRATVDDPTEWGDAEPVPAKHRSEKRRLAAMVSVRLAPEELRALQESARVHGMTVSAYLRSVALEHVHPAAGLDAPAPYRVRDASVGVMSFHTTSEFVHAQVVTHVPAST